MIETDLPKVFRHDTTARSFVVRTSGDLQKALSAPNDTMPLARSVRCASAPCVELRATCSV